MEVKGIIDIDIEQIYPHPGNPRKNLGDLEELADSIKKNGVMQNLTVIPGHWDEKRKWFEDGYTLIIGHRRCAAAKKADVQKMPCRIVEGMDEKEQMSTMLEENMQRNDLTVYEQAQGFQMMLDLGETEETIADKTGFSKTTIRHRLNIAKLDQKKLQEKEKDESFQLSLKDLYELEKVESMEERNKCLEFARDSRDLAWRAQRAAKAETDTKKKKKIIEFLKKAGVQKPKKDIDQYSSSIETVKEFPLDKELPKQARLPKGETLLYIEYWNGIKVVKEVSKKDKVLTPEEIAKKQIDKNKKIVKEVLKEATIERREFIKNIISGKIEAVKDAEEIKENLFEIILTCEAFAGHNTIYEFFAAKECYNCQQEEMDDAKKRAGELNFLHKLLCIASALVGRYGLSDYNGTWYTKRGENMLALYTILEKYGFSFADESTKAVIDGTSELYVQKQNPN